MFEPENKGDYKFQTKVWCENDEIITGFIRLGDKDYEIFMCNKLNLDYAEVSYTDNATNTKIPTKRVELTEGRFAIIEAPSLKSYTRNVVFYDVNGNKYE